MKKIGLTLLIAFTVALAGCSGKKAAELFETAKFEELQNNREHAAKLYQEIIAKYPGTEEARQAEKRLAELRR